MKRILLIFLSIMMIISLTSCREKTKEEEFNDIQKTFSGIKNYTSLAEVTVTGNKSSKAFKVNHVFEKPNKYISEIIEPKNNSGNKTIYSGERAYLYNKKVDQFTTLKGIKASEDKALFLGYFLRNLNNVSDLEISRENIEEDEYLIIGIDIPGNNTYRSFEKLWIDTKTHLPLKLIIYDDLGKETVKVEYREVEYNTDIQKDIFKID